MNCSFPKAALLDLGNGKYSTIRIEYPWVPQKCSLCKIFGLSQLKCQVVKEMVDSGRTTCPDHTHIRPANGYVEAAGSSSISGPVSVATDIGNHITTLVKAGKDKDADIPKRLADN